MLPCGETPLGVWMCNCFKCYWLYKYFWCNEEKLSLRSVSSRLNFIYYPRLAMRILYIIRVLCILNFFWFKEYRYHINICFTWGNVNYQIASACALLYILHKLEGNETKIRDCTYHFACFITTLSFKWFNVKPLTSTTYKAKDYMYMNFWEGAIYQLTFSWIEYTLHSFINAQPVTCFI